MMVGLLDEVAERLRSIEKHYLEETPEGVVDTIEPITVTATVSRVQAKYGPWFSIAVFNDGADDVLVLVNNPKSIDWHRVISGEAYPVDFHRGICREILLKCDVGQTASVRVVGGR